METKNIPKLIFIIPYRNRETEKIHFSTYMKYILEDYNKNDYELYYSHQTDARPFNRGAIKNIGFLAIKEKYPNNYKNMTFVFNDIDTMPFKKNVLNYFTEKNIVKHFYGFDFALGGIFSINGEDFEKCNGFINNWGWGLEDNAMNNRVKNNNIEIDRTTFFNIKDKNICQLKDTNLRSVNNKDVNLFFKNIYDDINNINNLKYNITNHVIECNNENKNEYMINVETFNTRFEPSNKDFYVKDLNKGGKLGPLKPYKNPQLKMRIF